MDFDATTFEDLVYSALDGDETVYASPWIGDDAMDTVIEASEEVVMSRVEGASPEMHFGDTEEVNMIDSLDDYLTHRYGGSSGLDGEFVAPPGRLSGQVRDNPSEIRQLLKKWAEQTHRAVNDNSFSFYSDNIWSDARAAPLRKSEHDIQAEDINMDTRFILAEYFDRVEEVEGEDYSGVLATRE